MHHIGKRILGFGLTAAMLASVLPGTIVASAASASDIGTEGVSQLLESSGGNHTSTAE